jgi:hypothetical protein
VAGPPPADEMDGIDPEFIAALPPDLQAEVLEQQRRDRRLRAAAVRREQAQQQVSRLSCGHSCILSASRNSELHVLNAEGQKFHVYAASKYVGDLSVVVK